MKYDNLFKLKGKVAVVTGGAGLIGKELVRAFAEAGATTIVAEIDKNKGKSVANKLRALKLDVIFRPLDITKERSISDLIGFVDREYGHIAVWTNSAYPKTRDWRMLFEGLTVESWKKNIEMHLSGYFICCQKIAEYMKKQKYGSIVNFGSTYGIVGPDFSIYKGTKMTMPAPYSAIKGGIINFTRYLASYYGKYNVRINCISPGGVYDSQPRTFVKRYAAKAPLQRMANTGDIVGGALYLASDASSYVTGHNLVIDGGWTSV